MSLSFLSSIVDAAHMKLSGRKLSASRRGQIHMFETIGVLLVFSFLIGFSMFFYGRVQQATLEDLRFSFQELEAVKTSYVVSHLPELRCTLRNVETGACFDLEKIRAFNERSTLLEANYVELFGESTVWIDLIYPSSSLLNSTDTIVLYNLTPSGQYTVSKTPHPITVYDPSSRIYTMGVLWIDKYQVVFS